MNITDSFKAQQIIKDQSRRRCQPGHDNLLNKFWFLFPGFPYSVPEAMETGIKNIEFCAAKLRKFGATQASFNIAI